MESSKRAICPERTRRVPPQFSWVDQRLVRDGHLGRLDAHAAALYLFLVTVADGSGMSWHGDASTVRRLSMDEARLRRARDDLVHAGLLAYAKPLYQVLSLDAPVPALALAPAAATPAPRRDAARGDTTPVPRAAAMDRTVAREHIAAIRASLGRRT